MSAMPPVDVQCAVFERTLAQRTGVVGVAVLRVQAVHGAVQDARDAGLAGTARASEQVCVCRPAEPDGVPQRAGDVFLADDLFKTPWSPTEIERAMGFSGSHFFDNTCSYEPLARATYVAMHHGWIV